MIDLTIRSLERLLESSALRLGDSRTSARQLKLYIKLYYNVGVQRAIRMKIMFLASEDLMKVIKSMV